VDTEFGICCIDQVISMCLKAVTNSGKMQSAPVIHRDVIFGTVAGVLVGGCCTEYEVFVGFDIRGCL
jgi:hypothetical protein